MNKSVWIFQQPKEVRARGAAGASWYVGWYDLDGNRHSESCGPGARGKNNAEKRQRRIQSELDTGIHQPRNRRKWSDFRKQYTEQILQGKAFKTQQEAEVSLNHFERLLRVGQMTAITTQAIDDFVARRRRERGRKPGSLVLQPSTRTFGILRRH